MQTELNYDTVFDAQEHFRVLLDSMSRPGKINLLPAMDILPPNGFQHAAALTAFALLNNDVTFYIAGNNSDDIAEYLLINTGAHHADIKSADYIFIPRYFYEDELYEARVGTAIYPEDSATIIAESDLISEQPHDGSTEILLKGPGVDGEAKIYISGISEELLEFLKAQNEEYPLGIDMIITDKMNNVMGLPRSNRFAFE
jgi:alpha-D-ribose 1-methylphosphonate 5-triphosphate synthase subunit PhnH